MKKKWISYTLLHHLKQGKCFVNCKLCYSIRNNFSICRHITDSRGCSDKSTICSVSGETIQEFPKTSFVNHTYVTKLQPEVTGERNSNVMACCEDASQPELLPFDSSGERQICSAEIDEQFKGSFRSGYILSIMKYYKLRHRKCLGTLLHKAYVNLRENHLLPGHKNNVIKQSKYQMKKSLNLQEASLPNQNAYANCLDICLQSEIPVPSCRINGSLSEKSLSNAFCSSNAKELFNSNMYNKYQSPTPEIAEKLSAMFPDPEKLLSAVVKSMMRVDENCALNLLVTDHLQQRYWKAHLTLTHPQNITVRGVHPDRDKAIRGAYLYMCEELKKMALIFEGKGGKWMPMTCDKVMMILETLSKYGESSIGCSKGRGFKIVLEQIKDKKSCAVEKFDSEVDNNLNEMKGKEKRFGDRTIENYFGEKIDVHQNGKICMQDLENIVNVANEKKYLGKHDVPLTNVAASSNISNMDIENISAVDKDLLKPDMLVNHRSKPKWICTIHVGWPFPFSVQGEGLSLPAAQIIGYMSVISRLKIKGLLTPCNSSIASRNIEHLIYVHTHRHWIRSIQMLEDKACIDKFDADAEIFCDASIKGFGAFLSLKGTQKVSWLSEEWEEHRFNWHHFRSSHNDRHLHTLVAELFTVVTAVFTWKHKLRSRKLLCFSDNLAVMGLINSFTSEPLKPDTCKNSLDYLIHTLQTTCRDYSIKLQATWLDRQENWLADHLSRSDVAAFRAAVPEAAVNKTKAKKLSIREGKCT